VLIADTLDALLNSPEPSVRYRTRVQILGEGEDVPALHLLRQEIGPSGRVRQLLSQIDGSGRLGPHAYSKWTGAHWTLASLADLCYPPGDADLIPLREQVYEWLLSERHQRGIKTIDGRVRRCASQEGNAVYYLLALGIADERTDELATRLKSWQWPDGGWNCDKNPAAVNSSFMESLIPLRGLALYARLTGDRESLEAAQRAAAVFLRRRLFRRQADGSIIRDDFVLVHYPCYWHYDILFSLKVLAEAGMIMDERCHDALGLLEAKQLPDGGFPAEAKYYQARGQARSGRSLVDWGGTGKRRMNEWVTLDALYVLKEAGRIDPRSEASALPAFERASL
jgi:hypothetical protein